MVLEKALAKNREERFSSASELASALVTVLRGDVPDLDHTRPIPTHVHLPSVQKKSEKPARSRMWIFGGLAVLAAAALVWSGVRFAKATPSPTPVVPISTATLTVAASPSATDTPPPLLSDTPTARPPAATATTAPLPGLGGADKIALLTDNDLWLLDVDGGGIFQSINDGKIKLDLQWLPGGHELLYVQGGCVNLVNVETQARSLLTCFENFAKFEGFQVSPDGKQVAISIDRRLLVLPFDREVLAKTHTRYALENLPSACLVYTAVAARGAQWSADNQKLAVLFQSAKNGKMADFIRVIDVHRCRAADPLVLDEFPNKQFNPDGYASNPVLPAYAWDGNQRFLLNTFKRNEGYGDLYLYDMSTGEARKINPIDGTCCYRDAQFSPDGKYILFAFQDLRLGEGSETQLYYFPLAAIGATTDFKPIKLPPGFFPNLRESVQPVLRRAAP
jgi:hypothetical protein